MAATLYSISVTINSTKLTTNHGNVVYNLTNPIYLDSTKGYTCYLHDGIIYNCWTNISSAQNNNTLRVRDSFGDWFTITIPDGNYEFYDLALYFYNYFENLNMLTTDEDGDNVPPIWFEPIRSLNKCSIHMQGGWQWDNTQSGNFGKIVGFTQSKIYDATSQYYTEIGDTNANISNDINQLQIHCSLVDPRYSTFNSESTDIIYSPHITASAGSAIQIEPKNVIPIPVNTNVISNIVIRITDSLGRDLILAEPITLTLVIQRMPN